MSIARIAVRIAVVAFMLAVVPVSIKLLTPGNNGQSATWGGKSSHTPTLSHALLRSADPASRGPGRTHLVRTKDRRDGGGQPESKGAAARGHSSSPDPGQPESGQPTPGQYSPLTEDQLEAALLTAGELPGGGYGAEPQGAGITTGSIGECPELNALSSSASAQAEVAFFRDSSSDPDAVSEMLLQYTIGDAEAQMKLFASVPQDCATLSAKAGGFDLAITISAESFPVTGDQTVALRINATLVGLGTTISGDLVAVRHGGTLLLITNVGLPLDSGLTRSLVSMAYAKVAAQW